LATIANFQLGSLYFTQITLPIVRIEDTDFYHGHCKDNQTATSVQGISYTLTTTIWKTTSSCISGYGEDYVSLDDIERTHQRKPIQNYFPDIPPPNLIDEVQLAPELFRSIKRIVTKVKSGIVLADRIPTFHLMQHVRKVVGEGGYPGPQASRKRRKRGSSANTVPSGLRSADPTRTYPSNLL
jgi:hypothetical protein